MEPRNYRPFQLWVFGQLFLAFTFLQSHSIFGISRASGLLNGVRVPHDTPVSYLRSSVSLSHHWNWFHKTWRDFFLKYIFMPLGGGWLGLTLVVAFSVALHGFKVRRRSTHPEADPPAPGRTATDWN